ncbi:SH3 domain-containing protein [Sedimentisphaera salicampi]|uniref:SH3 domain protein n=1 Tax=Sedimentisphaera salicampi TaxID=1941349 RepID=A0A1W6LM11_9BACT|nr:hypothetical protein [Sedimentisphaera salicampi]ARN56805.1 SH3 domain protein [Sedimentisphaera salicampi]
MRQLSFLAALIFVSAAVMATGHDFPYKAKVAGENVFVRSGAGMNYYRCARVSSPEEVTVTAERFGWSRIQPLDTCYSLIAKQYVKKSDSGSGVVEASNVNVWAGSPYVSPVHSTTRQLKLNSGTEVQIIGIDGDYYKIRPPRGASYWINSAYLEAAESEEKQQSSEESGEQADESQASAESSQDQQRSSAEYDSENGAGEVSEGEAGTSSEEKDQDKEAKPEPQKPQLTPEQAKKRKQAYQEYLRCAELVSKEKEKPIEVQDYKPVKKRLKKIIEGEQSGRAAVYAEALLGEVNRYEAAKLADEMLRDQDSELARRRSEIRKKYSQKENQITREEGYAYTGVLAKSYVYTGEDRDFRFAVKDRSGSIKAYAEPANSSVKARAMDMLGKTVGFKGEIIADPATSKVVVHFSQVFEIWEPKTGSDSGEDSSSEQENG